MDVWARKHLSDFLRNVGDPEVVGSMIEYVLSLDSRKESQKELTTILGISGANTLEEARKLDFIDSFIYQKFGGKKPKKHQIKIQMGKNTGAEIAKAVSGPVLSAKRLCNCMAREHRLIGNCLACGKIICEMEGLGPCMFCGTPLHINKKLEVSNQASFTKAVANKEKLIKFDKKSEKRMGIIDDQMDWYDVAGNNWLPEQHRKAAAEKAKNTETAVEEMSRTATLTIDVASKKATFENKGKQAAAELKAKEAANAGQFLIQAAKSMNTGYNKDLDGMAKQVYDRIMARVRNDDAEENHPGMALSSKIQHEDPFAGLQMKKKKVKKLDPLFFKDDQDSRQCLSMHQPWASLLILGFKRVEGREWSTDYRGPLWIHAAAHRPTEEAIRRVEQSCLDLYGDTPDRPEFPSRYPTGVLIGRCELVDCLSQQDYRLSTPKELQEDNDSKYLFMIANPSKLIVPIQMHGGKQIFKLEYEAWQGVKKGLRRVYTGWWPPREEEVKEEDLYT